MVSHDRVRCDSEDMERLVMKPPPQTARMLVRTLAMTDTKKTAKPGPKSLLAILGVLLLAAVLELLGVPLTGPSEIEGAAGPATDGKPTATELDLGAGSTTLTGGVAEIEQAFRYSRSDVIVEAGGEVVKILADDLDEPRHQKFLVEVSDDLTLLFAHNIDLAPRVPLDEGDWIEFKGEYEYTDKGGTVHWTHHDPKGWREGGWIRLDGRTYE
jgi:hypothetical protein